MHATYRNFLRDLSLCHTLQGNSHLKSYLDMEHTGCTWGNHNKTPVVSHWLLQLSSLFLNPSFTTKHKNLLWQWTREWMKCPGHFTFSSSSFQWMKFHEHWLTTIGSWAGYFYQMTGGWKASNAMRHWIFWRSLSAIIFKRCWFKLAAISINFGRIIIGTKNDRVKWLLGDRFKGNIIDLCYENKLSYLIIIKVSLIKRPKISLWSLF